MSNSNAKLMIRHYFFDLIDDKYMHCRNSHYRTKPFISIISELMEYIEDKELLDWFIIVEDDDTSDPRYNKLWMDEDRVDYEFDVTKIEETSKLLTVKEKEALEKIRILKKDLTKLEKLLEKYPGYAGYN
jgi:hypothetical protein